MFNDEGLGAAMAQHYTEEKAKQAITETENLRRRVDALEHAVRLLFEKFQDINK